MFSRDRFGIMVFLLVAVVIVLFCVGLIFLFSNYQAEYFKSKGDKADKIYNWFKNTDNKSYAEFRRSVSGDIVDYENARNLEYSGQLSKENLMNLI